MTKHILQNILILILALLCLGLLFLTVLDLIPANTSGLQLSEEVAVSSSRINANDEETHISVVRGTFQNPTENTVEIERVQIVVSNEEGDEKTVELDGVTLLPRTDREFSSTWTEDKAYDRILSITVTVDGAEDLVPNKVSNFSFGSFAILYLILLAIFAFLLVWACKVRYYMYQEDLEKEKNREA